MPGWSDIFDQVNTHTQPLVKLTELRHNYLKSLKSATIIQYTIKGRFMSR